MDLDVHYLRMSLLVNMSFDDIFEMWGGKYFLLYSYASILLELGFPKEILPSTFTLVGYLILFRIFFDITKRSECDNSTTVFLLFLVVLLNDRFFGLSNGLRAGLAFHFAVLYIYSALYLENKTSGKLSAVLSIIIHPAASLPIFVFLLTRLTNRTQYYRYLLYASLIIFLLSEVLYYQLTSLLKPVLISLDLYSPTYFEADGAWSGNISEHQSFKGYIFSTVFRGLPFYLMVLYLYFWKPIEEKSTKRFYHFLCFFSVVLSLLSTSYAIYQRYIFFYMIAFCFYYTINTLNVYQDRRSKLYLLVLLLALLNYNVATLYSFFDVVSQMFKPFLLIPLPFALL
ncbi:hypothetical protein AB6C94_13920 [Vibrio splendidus]